MLIKFLIYKKKVEKESLLSFFMNKNGYLNKKDKRKVNFYKEKRTFLKLKNLSKRLFRK